MARQSRKENDICLTVACSAEETTYRVRPGLTLAHALYECAVNFPLHCGGKGMCGKCRIKAEGELGPLTAIEISTLTTSEIAAGVRMACQANLIGNTRVWLDDIKGSRILTGGLDADEEPVFNLPCDPSVRYGAALDIGTTTLAMSIWMLSPEVLRLTALGELNPQRALGADVISRIGAALEGSAGELRSLLLQEVLRMLTRLCVQADIQPEALGSMVITGNTTMLYLLTETNPEPLSHAPFVITERFGRELPGSLLSPQLSECRLYLPLCVSAFVGADIMCAVLACDLTKDMPRMLCDLGTNGEIALYDGRRLLCASTAAGPALEGASIHQGMQAQYGAIDLVQIENGALVCRVIGGGTAKGICGSGILDAVASALTLNLLDESGALCSDAYLNGISLRDGVMLTQKDIRQVQLCKAAIRAGVETLMEQAGLHVYKIKTLYLAGGLGTSIRPESAADIGLFPRAMLSVTKAVGNAALRGAELLLTQPERAEKLKQIVEAAKAIDLSTDPYFSERFMKHMTFDEAEDDAVSQNESDGRSL